MQSTAVQPNVKGKTDSQASTRCEVCRQPRWKCQCRWGIGPGERLIRKASGMIRVIANTYKLTKIRLTTGRTVRECTLIQGLSPQIWLVESTPLPTPGASFPKSSFYTCDVERCECDCPDSNRRQQAGLGVDHPLRCCKHLAALKVLLARSEAIQAA